MRKRPLTTKGRCCARGWKGPGGGEMIEGAGKKEDSGRTWQERRVISGGVKNKGDEWGRET